MLVGRPSTASPPRSHPPTTPSQSSGMASREPSAEASGSKPKPKGGGRKPAAPVAWNLRLLGREDELDFARVEVAVDGRKDIEWWELWTWAGVHKGKRMWTEKSPLTWVEDVQRWKLDDTVNLTPAFEVRTRLRFGSSRQSRKRLTLTIDSLPLSYAAPTHPRQRTSSNDELRSALPRVHQPTPVDRTARRSRPSVSAPKEAKSSVTQK